MSIMTTLRALALATLLCAFLPACAALKTVVRGASDICEIFAAEHPAEFRDLVQDQLASDPEQLASAQRDGFDPRVLCVIPAVLEPFLAQQNALAAAHRPAD